MLDPILNNTALSCSTTLRGSQSLKRPVVDGTMFVFVDDSLHGEKFAGLGRCILLNVFQNDICCSLEFPWQRSEHHVIFVRRQLVSLVVAVDGVSITHVCAQCMVGELAIDADEVPSSLLGFKCLVLDVLLRKFKSSTLFEFDLARCVNRHRQCNRKVCRHSCAEVMS